MEDLFIFMVVFIVALVVNFIVYFINRAKGEIKKMQEIRFLVAKYRLKNINYNKVGLLVVLINSFIIATAGTVCTAIDLGFVWQIIIGFGILMTLVILCYGLLGFILKKGSNK